MNWLKIKSLYPKAWEELLKFYHAVQLEINDKNKLGFYFTDGVHSVLMFNEINIRELYNFFDSHFIRLFPIFYNEWGYEIQTDFEINSDDLMVKDWYESRSEAEQDGFLKAFELLETKK